MTWQTCPDCLTYVQVRQPVLAPALATRADETNETDAAILNRYMGGVHTRHLAGLPILPIVIPITRFDREEAS